jgi:hypothetical protein
MSHLTLPISLLKKRRSPLSFFHGVSCSMTVLFSQYQIETQTSSVLHGKRTLRFPLIALTTRRSMGPSRHVLSQMVVAGTMTVHPPYNPDKTNSDYAAVKPINSIIRR